MKIELDTTRTSTRLVALLTSVMIAVPLAFVVVPATAAALIGTADIENGAITSAKIAQGAVQVRNVSKPVVHEVGAAGQVPFAPPSVWGEFRTYNGSPFGNLSYYKDAAGVIHLTGLTCLRDPNHPAHCNSIAVGVGTLDVFTLPKGFRPSAQQLFTTLSDGNGQYFHVRIDVTMGGVVRIVTPPDAGLDWVSFDGVSFLSR